MAVLNFFAFLNVYKSKTQLIKIHNSLNSSRRYGRLFENKKKERLGNYFCLKMISKFSKKNIYISEASKPTEDMKFRLDMKFFCTCPSTYEFNTIQKLLWALNRNISKL